MHKPIMHHIPVCPFSQRVEILLELKGIRDAVQFHVVDITKPRDPALMAKSRGSTALPMLELADGRILRESLVLLRYIEDRYPANPAFRQDSYERAVENMFIALEADFTGPGYRFVMNQDKSQRAIFEDAMNVQYAKLDAFLQTHAPDRDFLFDQFGAAEAVFTPLFMRFWFLEYYEGYRIPDHFARVRRWHDACIEHPVAQQVCREEIVKCYYDYALGVGNGALPPGRTYSSFAFEPHWKSRPWPPRDKWAGSASDAALGLL